ncbi:MAG TPA: hypothetical protein VIE91_02740 [Methylophilaceae bacterium]|jgi:hypothetical protein
MPRLLILLFLTTSFFVSTTNQACAQESPYRPAKKEEIVGFWQLVPLAEARKPHEIIPDPWPSMCQWFAYYDDGSLKTIDKLHEPCDKFSDVSLGETMKDIPSVVSWEYHAPALISVKRSDVKNYFELWEVTYVTEAFPKESPEFLPGDLILYLRNPKINKLLYIRHLRRLNNE